MDQVEITKVREGPLGRLPLEIGARITPDDLTLPICDLVLDRTHPHRDGKSSNPLQLREVTFSARVPDCPVIAATGVRAPIARYIDMVIDEVTRRYGVVEEPVAWHGGRGRRITADQLAVVASIYRDAVDNGRPPLRELESRLSVAHSTAGRLVVQARRAGALGPAPSRRGVAGESAASLA